MDFACLFVRVCTRSKIVINNIPNKLSRADICRSLFGMRNIYVGKTSEKSMTNLILNEAELGRLL
jgi:hypothetical protein